MKALFFARDPGAANVLATLFTQISGDIKFFAKDFARDVCRNKKIPYIDFNKNVSSGPVTPDDFDKIHSWMTALDYDCYITGTTNVDDYSDRLIWRSAESLKKTSIAILDTWHSIDRRFIAGGKQWKPDYVFTPGNILIPELKEKCFARIDTVAISHSHLQSVINERHNYERRSNTVRDELKELFGAYNKLAVFSSEPELGPVAEETAPQPKKPHSMALDLTRKVLEFDNDWLLLIKLHPKQIEQIPNAPNIIQNEFSALDLASVANVVIGINSMFLLESLLLKTPVISMEKYIYGTSNFIANNQGWTTQIDSDKDLSAAIDHAVHQSAIPLDVLADALGLQPSNPTDLNKVLSACVRAKELRVK